MADRMKLGASGYTSIEDVAVADHTGTPSDNINGMTSIKFSDIPKPSASTPTMGVPTI